MLQGLSNAVDKLVTDPSGRRTRIWIAIILLGASIVTAYELYTDHFRLGRLSDQVQMLEQLEEVRSHPSLERDSTLRQAYEGIRDQLAESVKRDPVLPAALPTLPPRVSQAAAAFAPWLFLMILFAGIPAFRPEAGVTTLLVGMLMIAVPFTIGGALIPPSLPTVVRHVLYPVLGTVIVMFVVWSVGRGRQE